MELGLPDLKINGFGADGQAMQDHRVYAEFYTRSIVDPTATKEKGRPVHKSAVYVKIQHPGERDRIDRQATEEDVNRFRKQFEAFEQGRADVPDGTPLAILFPNHPELVEDLKYFRIQTVEQMAAISDSQMQAIGMGAREWARKAQALLDASQSAVPLQQYQQENQHLKEQMAAMQAKIDALSEAVPVDEQRRGPGRPPKIHQEA